MRKIAAEDRDEWKRKRQQFTRSWAKLHVEYTREYQRAYRQKNKARLTAAKHLQRKQVRVDGLAAYGGKCTCCGESNTKFLTLEHKKGRRKGTKRHTGYKAWCEVKRLGYPPEFTILCFNCNCARGIYGKCPHEEERTKDG